MDLVATLETGGGQGGMRKRRGPMRVRVLKSSPCLPEVKGSVRTDGGVPHAAAKSAQPPPPSPQIPKALKGKDNKSVDIKSHQSGASHPLHHVQAV